MRPQRNYQKGAAPARLEVANEEEPEFLWTSSWAKAPREQGKWDVRAQREGPGKHSGRLTLSSAIIGLCVKNGSEETAGLYIRTSLGVQFRGERLFKKIQCQRQEQRILKYEGVLAPR